MASFRKRSNRWQARVTRKGMTAIVKTFQTKADAEKWARAVERELDLGTFVPNQSAASTTLSALIDRYRQEVVPQLRGAHTERIRLDTIARSIGKQAVAKLTPQVIATFRDDRLKSVSPSTVLRELQTLSAMINHARREWSMAIDNPVSAIRKPSANKARDRRLSPEEEMTLLAALDCSDRRLPSGRWAQGTRNPWVRAFVELALETAMRRGELLALRWEDVDLTRRYAQLRLTKNGDDRKVPLSKAAIAVLTGLPRSQCGRVLPITPNALKHAWNRARSAAGLPDLHLHDLRHEGASRLALKLPNLIELSHLTGHRDLKMLARYYHPRLHDLLKKLD